MSTTNFCFYMGANALGADYKIYYATFDSNLNFSESNHVDKVFGIESPGLAVYNNNVYCFYQPCTEDGTPSYAISYFTVEPLGYSSSMPVGNNSSIWRYPALVVFNGLLYCFYQGYGMGDGDGQIWYFSYDGANFTNPSQVPLANIVGGAPAVAVFNGKIYCFYKGVDSTPYCVTFDGNKFAPPFPLWFCTRGIRDSFGLYANADVIVCARQAQDPELQLCIFTYDGEFSSDQPVDLSAVEMSLSPSLFNPNCVFYQGWNGWIGANRTLYWYKGAGIGEKIDGIQISSSPAIIVAPW